MICHLHRGFYKNLTGVNLGTTPDLDTTNWVVEGVSITATEQCMGYQIGGKDVYEKYVALTSPTGTSNLVLQNGVTTLFSVNGVVKRSDQSPIGIYNTNGQ